MRPDQKLPLSEFLANYPMVEHHGGLPRYHLDGKGWRTFEDYLAQNVWGLLGLWSDGAAIFAVFRDEELGDLAVISHDLVNRRFVSLAAHRPAAIRLERSLNDLFGISAQGNQDMRPWLDHGKWLVAQPMGTPKLSDGPKPYDFLKAEGEGLHQIPVGPVHAGVIEPGHFRFHCQGETVVRLEERLGYLHRGLPRMVEGQKLDQAAKIIARTSGDSAVAYGWACAMAVEAALGVKISARAQCLRVIMAELERMANHAFDIGAICNDAAFAIMLSHMGALREDILRFNATHFGHRLNFDKIVAGGVTADLSAEGVTDLRALLDRVAAGFERAMRIYDETPSLLDRTNNTGAVGTALVQRFGAGGFVGRAAGRAFDARRSPGYGLYADLDFEIPVLYTGDVHSRLEIRAREFRQSIRIIDQVLVRLPKGDILAPIHFGQGMGQDFGHCEGTGVVESFRGEVVVWLRLNDQGYVQNGFVIDPSWFQWPLLEASIDGNIVADFPLCNKSFNCSYAGVDL